MSSVTLHVRGGHTFEVRAYLAPSDVWEPLTLEIARSLMRLGERAGLGRYAFFRDRLSPTRGQTSFVTSIRLSDIVAASIVEVA